MRKTDTKKILNESLNAVTSSLTIIIVVGLMACVVTPFAAMIARVIVNEWKFFFNLF